MTLYLVLALVMTFIGYENYDTKSKLINFNYYFVWILLSLFWGLSYIYAPDIPGYISYFNFETYNWFDTGIKLPDITFEIGFNVLSCVIKSFTNQYYVFQFILFTIELFLVMEGMKKLIDKKETIIIICALFFILPMNLLGALRQGIAISLFIYSLHYILERNLFKYIGIIIFSALFHKSSLFLLFLYWIPLLGEVLLKRRLLMTLLILLNICYIINFSISDLLDHLLVKLIYLTEETSSYVRYTNIEGNLSSNFGFFKVMEMNFVYVVFILIDKNKIDYVKLSKLLFLIYFALNMLLGGILAHRIGYYFVLMYQICLMYSICWVGKYIFHKIEIGYLLSCVYYTFLYIFYFNDYILDEMVYKNLFLEYILYGTY